MTSIGALLFFILMIIAMIGDDYRREHRNEELKSAEKKGRDEERQRTLDLDEEQAYSMNSRAR